MVNVFVSARFLYMLVYLFFPFNLGDFGVPVSIHLVPMGQAA